MPTNASYSSLQMESCNESELWLRFLAAQWNLLEELQCSQSNVTQCVVSHR